MTSFGSGERFKPCKEIIPGPGHYDVEIPKGFKADPKSGFVGGERFNELEKEGALPELSPLRERMKPPNSENRKYTWATHRIHDLELELEKAKHTIKELKAQRCSDKQEFDELLQQQHKLLQDAENEKNGLEGKLKEALASSAERSRIQMALESQQKDQEAIGDLQGQLHAAILDAQRTETEYAVCKCRADQLQKDLSSAEELLLETQTMLGKRQEELCATEALLLQKQEAEAAIQADLESLSKQLEGEVCARQRLQKCRAELETLLDRLREELEVDRARYEECKATVCAKDAELGTALQENEMVVAKMNEVQSDLEDLRNEHRTLQGKHEQLLEQYAEKEIAFLAAEVGLQQLSLEKTKLASSLAETEKTLAESVAEGEDLNRQLSGLRHGLQEEREQVDSLQASLEGTQRQLREAQESFAAVEIACQEKLASAQQEAAILSKLQQELSSEISSVSAICTQLRGELELQERAHSAAEAEYRQEVQNLLQQLSEERATASGLQSKLEEQTAQHHQEHEAWLADSAAVMCEANEKLAGVQEELTASTRKLEEMAEAEMAERQRYLETVSKLEQNLCGAELRLAASEAANDHLLTQLASLELEKDSSSQRLQSAIEDHSRERQEHMEEVDRLQHACQEADTKASDMEKQLNTSAQKLAALEESSQQLSHRHVLLEEELARAQSALASHEEELTSERSQVAALTAQIAAMTEGASVHETKLRNATVLCQNLSAQVEFGEGALRAADAEAAASRVKMQTLLKNNSESSSRLVSTLSQRLADMEMDQYQTRWTLESCTSAGSALSRRVAALQVQVMSMAAQHHALTREHAQVLASNAGLQMAKETLSEQLKAALGESTFLSERLDALSHMTSQQAEHLASKDAQIEHLKQLHIVVQQQLDDAVAMHGIAMEEAHARQARLEEQLSDLALAVQAAAAREAVLIEQQTSLDALVAEKQLNLEEATCSLAKQQEQLSGALTYRTVLERQLQELREENLQQTSSYECKLSAVTQHLADTKAEADAAHGRLASQLHNAVQNEQSLEAALQDGNLAIERLKVTLTSTEDQLTSARAHISAISTDLSSHKKDLGDAVSRLEVAKCELATLHVATEEHEEERMSLQQALLQSQQDASSLRAELAEQRQQAVLTGDQLSEAQTGIRRLEEAIQELEGKCCQQEKTAAAQALELRMELLNSREALGAEQALRAQRDEEIAGLLSELADMQSAATKMHAELTSLQNTKEDLSAAKAKASEYERDATETRREVGTLQNTVKSLEEELQKAKEETVQAKELYQFMREEAQSVLGNSSQTAALEMRRLLDENNLLDRRVKQMELDLQELQVKPVIGNSSLLGHNNRKQPIQYHLRLKQELEEMRRECTHLLKENFQLEQCIRYLASADTSNSKTQVLSEQRRSTIAKIGAKPSSLIQSPIFATPVGRNSMLRAGRSKIATELGAPWQSKAEMLAQITHTVQDTASSINTLAHGLCLAPEKENEGGIERRQRSSEKEGSHFSSDPAIEARILERVASVCSPWKKVKANTTVLSISCSSPVEEHRIPLSPLANREATG